MDGAQWGGVVTTIACSMLESGMVRALILILLLLPLLSSARPNRSSVQCTDTQSRSKISVLSILTALAVPLASHLLPTSASSITSLARVSPHNHVLLPLIFSHLFPASAPQVDAVVCVASEDTDSLAPRPILARSVADILSSRGVKPILSPSLELLPLLLQDSSVSRVLVCGVGCQVGSSVCLRAL